MAEKKKGGARFGAVAILGIFFIIWNLLVFAIAGKKIKEAGTNFWFSYAFIVLAFLVSGGVMAYAKTNKERIFSIYMPLFIATAAYFALVFVVNTIIMLAGFKSDKILWNIIFNAIFILVYGAFAVISIMGINHIAGDAKEIEKNVKKLKLVLINLKDIRGNLTNEEYVKIMSELCDAIEFSDPMTVEEASDIENKIRSEISDLEELVNENPETEIDEEFRRLTKRIANDIKKRNELVKACK